MSLEPWVVSREIPLHELIRLQQVVTGRSRRSLLVDASLSTEEERRLDDLVGRRVAGEPLQYLEGSVSFGGLEIAVDFRVLIPRPETEELFELAAAMVVDPAVIVDLGTGSGNLALALKHRFPDAAVYATDNSADAVAVAQENASRLGLDVVVFTGDLFDPLPPAVRGAVDLIVANPPYVAAGDELPAVVAGHEPAAALFAGSDGLDVIRRIAVEASGWLAPGGALAVEVGAGHAAAAAALFTGLDVRVAVDMFGNDRFVFGRQAADRE